MKGAKTSDFFKKMKFSSEWFLVIGEKLCRRRRTVIAWTSFDRRQINAFQNQQEFFVGQIQRSFLLRMSRKLKSTLFQAFVKKPEAIAIP
jgi:hypothetical protein